jgi:hypothetical protein
VGCGICGRGELGQTGLVLFGLQGRIKQGLSGTKGPF